MMKFAVPIFIDNEFLGVAGGCGMLNNGGQVDTYLVHRTAGLSEKIISDASETVKPLPAGRLAAVVSYLEGKVGEIIQDHREKITIQHANVI